MKKVLISKIGLDGHEVGARMIVKLLEENGFEVEYLGIRQKISDIIKKACDFKPDAIGISIMTGGHSYFMPKLKSALNKVGMRDTKLICGGLIPESDKKELLSHVDAVFNNESNLNDILEFFQECI